MPRVKKFKYLRPTVQESDSCEREVKKRVQQNGTDGEKYQKKSATGGYQLE